MSTAIQLRRGTTTEHNTFTGAVGEITVDVTKDTLVVHDGSTAGGFPVLNVNDKNTTIAEITAVTQSVKVPTGTQAQRDGSPTAGYFRFNSDTTSFEGYDGSAWGAVGGGNSTGNGLWEHAATISSDYSMTAGNNALSAGPIVIDTGITVTVPSGSVWTIV